MRKIIIFNDDSLIIFQIKMFVGSANNYTNFYINVLNSLWVVIKWCIKEII